MSDGVRKAQVVEYDKRLRELVELAPDDYARRDIYRALLLLRKRYAVSPEKKKEVILQMIADGAATFTEIFTETGYTYKQVWRTLKELREEKKIREEKVSINGRGRPRICYFEI